MGNGNARRGQSNSKAKAEASDPRQADPATAKGGSGHTQRAKGGQADTRKLPALQPAGGQGVVRGQRIPKGDGGGIR